MRKLLTKVRKRRAIVVITETLRKDATESQLRTMLCAVLGHPPVVTTFFGYINCARCGEQVGDSLGGANTAKNRMVVGHKCEMCDAIRKGLTPDQKLLTELEPEAV